MFDEEMITKYRYIILLIGTAVSFVLGLRGHLHLLSCVE